MPELSGFLSSLEFCDAVLQIAHPSVREHLLGLIYMGFLVPVLGPALTQVSLNFSSFTVFHHAIDIYRVYFEICFSTSVPVAQDTKLHFDRMNVAARVILLCGPQD